MEANSTLSKEWPINHWGFIAAQGEHVRHAHAGEQ
jgi:hypothetical protein